MMPPKKDEVRRFSGNQTTEPVKELTFAETEYFQLCYILEVVLNGLREHDSKEKETHIDCGFYFEKKDHSIEMFEDLIHRFRFTEVAK